MKQRCHLQGILKFYRCESGMVLPGVMIILSFLMVMMSAVMMMMPLKLEEKRTFRDYVAFQLRVDNAFVRMASILEDHPEHQGFKDEASFMGEGFCEMQVVSRSEKGYRLLCRMTWREFKGLYEGEVIMNPQNGQKYRIVYHLYP